MQLSAPVSPLCSVNYMACIPESVISNTDENTQFHHGTCPQAVRDLNSLPLSSTDQWHLLMILCVIMGVFNCVPFELLLCLMSDLAWLIWGRFCNLFLVWCLSFAHLWKFLSALFDAGVNYWILSSYFTWTSTDKCKAGHILPLSLRCFHGSVVNPPSSHKTSSSALWHCSKAYADLPCQILVNGYKASWWMQ